MHLVRFSLYLGTLTQKSYQFYVSFCSCSNDLKSLLRITKRLMRSFDQKQKFNVTLLTFLRQITLILFSLSMSSFSTSLFADGFYKWRDARGNIQYGDKPPKNVRLEKLDMPRLTVIQDYGSQWKSQEVDLDNSMIKTHTHQPISDTMSANYKKFTFIAPKMNQVIHAKEGDISAMLSISPPLKSGHSIVFVMDGKNKKKGTSRITNFTALSVGNHSLKASIINAQGKTIQNTRTIPFRLIRFDSASSRKKRKQ